MKLSEAIRLLSDAGVPDARFDAREIFIRLGNFSPAAVVASDPDCSDEAVISAIERRCAREPLQYIIGEVYFYKETYVVNSSCLIPRQDTEILVEYACRNIPEGERFADICTGSGCIGISVLCNTRHTECVMCDLSDGALEIASINAKRNGVSERAELILADVLARRIDGEFFAVLSNPPYVKEEDYNKLEREIGYEPRMAFIGADMGLEFYKKLTPMYKDHIKKDGFIAYEIGFDQASELTRIAEENGMTCEIIRDLGGLDRVAVLKKR